MILEHLDSVMARLRAIPNLEIHDDQVPADAALPHAIVRSDSGRRDKPALDGASRELRMRLWVTCVGASRESAQLAAEATAAALVDMTPAVAGRRCDPITQVDSQPVRLDEEVDPAVFYAVDLYELVSLPA